VWTVGRSDRTVGRRAVSMLLLAADGVWSGSGAVRLVQRSPTSTYLMITRCVAMSSSCEFIRSGTDLISLATHLVVVLLIVGATSSKKSLKVSVVSIGSK